MFPTNSQGGDQGGKKDGKRPFEGKEAGDGGDGKLRSALKYKRIVRRPTGIVLFGIPVAKAEGVIGGQEALNVPDGDGSITAEGVIASEDVRGDGVVRDVPLEGNAGGWEIGNVAAGDGSGSGGEEWGAWHYSDRSST